MAGLIPQSFIDDLLNRLDIIDVVGSRLQLKKSGKNYSACCPFHQEKTPSFTVSPDKQFYHCFGCGASGSALGFVMEYDHLNFPQAVELLAKQAGLEIPYEQQAIDRYKQVADSPLYDLLAKAADYYQQALKSHPTKQLAVDYFKKRGLTGIVARDFGLGFAPPGWDNLIKHLIADGADQKLLIDAGLIIENAENGRRYDRFRNRVIFPIRDLKGRIIAFGGRVLGDDKPKYLNSPETAIFHKGEILYGLYEVRKKTRQLDEILVLEGYMDVIALAQFGLTNAVATLGTATSEEHVKRLFQLVNNIVFCFDGDTAGRKAAWRALESALPYLQDGRCVKFLFLPDGEDPDSLVRSEGGDAFRARINQHSLSLTDYLFDHLMAEAQPDSLEGKAHLAMLATPLLTKIPKSSLRSLIYQRLTAITGLNQQQLQENTSRLQQISHVSHFEITNQPISNRDISYHKANIPMVTPIMHALRCLLHNPQLVTRLKNLEVIETTIDDYGKLLSKAIILLKETPTLNSFQLMGKLVSFDKRQLLTRLFDKEQLIGDQSSLEKEFNDTIMTIIEQQNEIKLDKLLNKGNSLTTEEKDQLRRLLAAKAKD